MEDGSKISRPRLWHDIDAVSSVVLLAYTELEVREHLLSIVLSNVHVEWVCMGHPSLHDCCLQNLKAPLPAWCLSACLVRGFPCTQLPMEGASRLRQCLFTDFHLRPLLRVSWKFHPFPKKMHSLKSSANDTRTSCRPFLDPRLGIPIWKLMSEK